MYLTQCIRKVFKCCNNLLSLAAFLLLIAVLFFVFHLSSHPFSVSVSPWPFVHYPSSAYSIFIHPPPSPPNLFVRPSSVCLFIKHSSLSVNSLIHLSVLSTFRLSLIPILNLTLWPVCFLILWKIIYLFHHSVFLSSSGQLFFLFIILLSCLKIPRHPSVHPYSFVYPFKCLFIHLSLFLSIHPSAWLFHPFVSSLSSFIFPYFDNSPVLLSVRPFFLYVS